MSTTIHTLLSNEIINPEPDRSNSYEISESYMLLTNDGDIVQAISYISTENVIMVETANDELVYEVDEDENVDDIDLQLNVLKMVPIEI